jgi:hypothetical protein
MDHWVLEGNYCMACGQCINDRNERATKALCWTCAVAFAGGVRLRASVNFPEIPEPEAVVLAVPDGQAAERQQMLESLPEVGRNVPKTQR